MWSQGSFYDFMKGFFGWHARTEWIRLLAYFGYLIPVLYLFLKKAPATTESEKVLETAGR
jgi:high-affinity Fe2+/Pb2+ permease